MKNAIDIQNLQKSYPNGNQALKDINLSVKKGEIFALLGPNGAGKSTLINIICGITKKNKGKINVFGLDIVKSYKEARSLIGMVPQEIATDSFEKVINTLKFSRGLFNRPSSGEYLESILKSLALYEKKDHQIRTLSGGMKRRVMIAKALSHEPRVLFLDEPTAGVDVHLRKELWKNLADLKKNGVTIFLTTHYIEEAEKIADRIGIINKGKLIVMDTKKELIEKLGKKTLIITLNSPLKGISRDFNDYNFELKGNKLKFFFDYGENKKSISKLLNDVIKKKIDFKNIDIEKTNLEEIFLNILEK